MKKKESPGSKKVVKDLINQKSRTGIITGFFAVKISYGQNCSEKPSGQRGYDVSSYLATGDV